MRAEFATTDRLRDLLTYVVEEVSLTFDRWDDDYVRGPDLYFVVAAGTRFEDYADPLGNNRWPVEVVRNVTADLDAVLETARRVAFDRDGAVVVTADGSIQEQMVRVRTPGNRTIVTGDYPDWMSAKHLSALEVSAHEAVLAAITLSEESGRVVVFEDGQFRGHERDDLGHPWRADSADGEHADGVDAPGGSAVTRADDPVPPSPAPGHDDTTTGADADRKGETDPGTTNPAPAEPTEGPVVERGDEDGGDVS